MRKIIAAMNITIDGFCDHTAMMADEEIHNHYTDLLKNAGAILYGRKTYQLMESAWPALVKTPSGDKSMDDFAIAIDNVPKIVFSKTLKTVTWKNTKLLNEIVKEQIVALKQQDGKDIFVGSPGLISALTELGLIDQFQPCVHPVIAGNGLSLFKTVTDRIELKLLKTKTFPSGQIMLYHEPANK
ncbi:MAG: dihydrofolate reductase family protein [Bacteroidetes bacterium]|nr:dihydrofolate reductase family protein [Bacteroidota bacterium]